LNTGQGDNELYAMNQNVQTSDSVTFDTLAVTNNATVGGSLTLTGEADFNSTMNIEGAMTTQNTIQSDNFDKGTGSTGWLADGATGFAIEDNSGIYDMYVDSLTVRGSLRVFELIAKQISAIGGTEILSVANGVVESSSGSAGSETVTLEDPNNTLATAFADNDLVLVQRFDPNDPSNLIKQEFRTVSVSSGLTLTLTTTSGAPTPTTTLGAGDFIVAYGNTAVGTSRGNIIYRNVEGQPIVRLHAGIDSYADFTSPATTTRIAYGDLNGFSGLSSQTFGFFAGADDGDHVLIKDDGLFFKKDNSTVLAELTSNTFKVGDTTNFISFDGSAFNIETNTFDLATSTLVVDSAANKIALGASADSITIDGTEVGFIADGNGEFKAYADANNYIRLANSALDIKAESFDLETSTVVLNSAGNGRLIVGADADNQLVDDGVGFFVTGDGNFRVGTIEQGSDSYIKFDGSTVSIVTNTFDLDASTLVIDSATNSGKIALGATPPTAYNSGTGIYFDGTGVALIGNASGNKIQFNGTNVDIQSTSFSLSGGGIDIDTAGTGIAPANPTQTQSNLSVNFKSATSGSPVISSDVDLIESERVRVLQIVFDYDISGGDAAYDIRIVPQFRDSSSGTWSNPAMNLPIITYPSTANSYFNTSPLTATLSDESTGSTTEFKILGSITSITDKVSIYIAADPNSIDYNTYDAFRFIVYHQSGAEVTGSFTADMYVRKYCPSTALNPEGFTIRQSDTIYQETVIMQDKLPIRQDKSLLFV